MSCPIDSFDVRPDVVCVEFRWFPDVFLPHRLLLLFCSALGGISAPKMTPKFIQISLFFQACFLTVFPSVFSAFLLASSAAGPLISLPWAMNPWCAHLFAKSKKYPKLAPKVSQNGSQNGSRSFKKSIKKLSQKLTRKVSDFGSQNGTKMDPKRIHLKWLSLPFLHSKGLLRFECF